MAKTPAQLQIEALRRLKEERPRADADAAAPARPGASTRAKPAHALPVGLHTWRLLRERQRATREFKGRTEQGEWAARLLLALPPGAHTLDDSAVEELFQLMRQYCVKKGLT